MDTQKPVGENRPPEFPAAKNEGHSAERVENSTAVDLQAPPAGQSPAQPTAAGAPQGEAPPLIIPAVAEGGAPLFAPAAPMFKPRQPFTATKADGVFALACLVLGFLFVRWVLLCWQGWGVAVFTLLFAGGVLGYAKARRVRPSGESWFWLAVVLLCGGVYAFWPPSAQLAAYQALLLVGAAVYWCACLFGTLLCGKTGGWLFLDGLNQLFCVPLRNFGLLFTSVLAMAKPKAGAAGLDDEAKAARGAKRRRAASVLVGFFAGLMVLAVVVPMLASADQANFGRLLQSVEDWLESVARYIARLNWDTDMVWQMVLGVPVALYLCGLVVGGAHKRYVANIDVKNAAKLAAAAKMAPAASVMMVLCMVSGVYVVFIGCQLPYFFSAFAGIKPQAYAVYSEYAREGFFELCRIAAINLGLLAAAGLLCRKTRREYLPLRVMNIVMSGLTLLVIATAFSKMGLYIAMHGFTQKRIMTCVFMAFLAGVCVAVVLLQKYEFSIVRFAAIFGAGLLCGLCLCNLDAVVARHNANRWREGTLPCFDPVIVERSGPAGALVAAGVYGEMEGGPEDEEKTALRHAMMAASAPAAWREGLSMDSATDGKARELRAFLFEERDAADAALAQSAQD